MRLPAFTSASGRVLLAHQSIDDVRRLISHTKITRLTRRTVVNKIEIQKLIDAAKQDGHSINREEIEEGLVSVAVPVLNRAGIVVAALNASTGLERASDRHLLGTVLPRLKSTATELSAMLP